MKIIITGATGFIGRNLAEQLHENGIQVIATGRNEEIGRALTSHGVVFRPADLSSPQALEAAFSPADCVIHCAAKAGDWGGFDEFYQTNVLGTRHVIQACRRHGINRLIFISTPSVYIDGRDRFDILESDPLPARQLTHYAITKLAAEQELLALSDEGFEVIIVRPRAVYGPYDNTFIPRLLRMAKRRRFPLIGGGETRVDVTYIVNLVELIRAALSAPSTAWNQVYNLSNGDPLTIARWFELMLGVVDTPFRPKKVPEQAAWSLAALMELGTRLPFGPKQPLITRFSVRYMARSMTLSIAKASDLLDYRPRFATEESFTDYAQRLSAV